MTSRPRSEVIQSLPPEAGVGSRLLRITAAVSVSLLIVTLLASVQSGTAEAEVEPYQDLRAVALPPPPPPLPEDSAPSPAPPEQVQVELTAGDTTIPVAGFAPVPVLGRKPEVVPQFDFDPAQFNPVDMGAGRSRIFDKSEVDQPVEMVYRRSPNIPPEILNRVNEPRVILLYVVNPQGRAENIQVLHSADPEFDAIMIQAIAGARFRPAVKDGKPVSQWVRQSLRVNVPRKSIFSL